MRQALGKLGARPAKQSAASQHRQQTPTGLPRHRFRQEGEVPVVRLALPQGKRSKEQVALPPGLEASPKDQHPQEGRGQAAGESGRALQELTEQLRAMQTRLGHAELALAEAVEATRNSQEEAAAFRQALEENRAKLEQARAELTVSERSRHALTHQLEAMQHRGPEIREASAVPNAPARRKVGRPFGSTKLSRGLSHEREPAPVKWWAGD